MALQTPAVYRFNLKMTVYHGTEYHWAVVWQWWVRAQNWAIKFLQIQSHEVPPPYYAITRTHTLTVTNYSILSQFIRLGCWCFFGPALAWFFRTFLSFPFLHIFYLSSLSFILFSAFLSTLSAYAVFYELRGVLKKDSAPLYFSLETVR